ncbi:hypothetical protein BASA50_003246 [Batrachochytrium salamandrivorans]|uniref:EGF-like domain-containing protein n=1 Tax=Batrachochytrium salamandrivorans TaxID=1357716 RepID=A0ABQ8FM58_9FUNG|nr:hypothetical protein BASA50_003246 [Batrachochytrium salamandrivorans]
MLSRLIITFLCAAVIGSVSGAFMTFDPAPVFFEDIEETINFSAKLNNKPTEEVTVHFNHPFMSMSTCVIVFNPNNWDVPRQITGVPAPLFVGSSEPPKQLTFNSKLLARAETVGPLSAELSSVDTLKVTQTNAFSHFCFIAESITHTFDGLEFFFNKPGWYRMMSTRDIEVQVFMDEFTAGLPCIKKVLFRYGSSVMGMDVSGPTKGVGEYSVTEVTQNTNGLRYTPGTEAGDHKIDFPYGLELHLEAVNCNGIVSLHVNLARAAGYPLPGGLCNIPRADSPDNRLMGFDGKFPELCVESQKTHRQNLLLLLLLLLLLTAATTTAAATTTTTTAAATTAAATTTTTTTTTTTATADFFTTTSSSTTISFSTYVSSFTMDLSKSTLSPTITYALSSTTITTSPSTTSTTSPYLPDPPAPGGYVHPPPPSPGEYVRPPPPPDVVVEIKKCCQSIFNIPSCNAIVPTEPYIQSCILDAQTFGSYVLSDKVKQTYLAKCRALTDDMILDPTKDVIDQGTKIRKEYGFGDGTCTNSCSGKGACIDFGCACSPGFSGMDCSMDLTKATQYDPSVNQYRINVNVTIVQQQMEQHSKMPGSVPSATSIPSVPYDTPAPSVHSTPSVPYATPAPSVSYATPAPSVHSTPSVDKSLASYVGYLPKPSTASPQIAKKSQPAYPKPYDDFQKPIFSSAISFSSLHMVSAAAVVITSYILLL